MTPIKRLIQNQDDAINKLFELLRIPSISTDPKWGQDCIHAADWLVDDLSSMGFEARSVTTGGHPFVIAHGPKVENAPHVLFYGHYDVQPVDPVELWNLDPFEPALIERDGRTVIHGRGASDDKGQVMTFVEACRAYLQTGDLPLNVSILIEGEEETGSPSLPAFLQKYGDEIRADLVLVCDTGMIDENTPSIASQLRGLMGEEIILRAADTDLHSGLFGGAAHNPAHILTQALSGLRDGNGRILIDGFYDGVSDISPELKADWNQLEDRGVALLDSVGLDQPAGEPEYSILEQLWSRPTMEINGIISGYTGDGFKTVLPAEARAKVSFRLVGDQDPEAIRDAFRRAIKSQLPSDCTVEFSEHGGSKATEMDISRPEFQAAKKAMQGLWSNAPVFVGMGGSIPITGAFKSALNMDSLLIGFAQSSDQIHAPNEKYDLSSFQTGAKAWLNILEAIAQT